MWGRNYRATHLTPHTRVGVFTVNISVGQQPELILPHSMFPVVNQPDRLEMSSSECCLKGAPGQSAQLMCLTVRWRKVPRDIGGLCRWSKCLLGIMMYLRSCLWSTVVDIVISLPLLSALWRINMYQWRSLLPSAGRYVNILLAVPSLLSSPITTLSTLITRKLSCSQSPTRPVHQANFSSGI